MKKLLAASLLICCATAASAIDYSAGASATVGGFWAEEYYEDYLVVFDERSILDATAPFGVSAWFDATYGVAAVGFRANGPAHRTITNVGPFAPAGGESDLDQRWGYLSLALLGRVPFRLGQVTLFPMLGFEVDLNLYFEDADGTDLKASLSDEQRGYLNQFWFKAGAGADFTLYRGLFVRPCLLFGFKVLNQAERDTLEDAETDPIDAADVARKTNFILEGGVQVGWRF